MTDHTRTDQLAHLSGKWRTYRALCRLEESTIDNRRQAQRVFFEILSRYARQHGLSTQAAFDKVAAHAAANPDPFEPATHADGCICDSCFHVWAAERDAQEVLYRNRGSE